jgi:4-alpha-glucanotransferase
VKQESQTVDSWRELAHAVGVSTAYEDGTGVRRATSVAGIQAILRALALVGGRETDPDAILRERIQKRWKRGLEPVVVAWEHHPFAAELSVPATVATKTAECRIRFENGAERSWSVDLSHQVELRRATIDEREYRTLTLPLIDPLPSGYHDLDVRVGAAAFHARVICAPEQAYRAPPPFEHTWGLFVPLYALHDESSWGVGDFRLLDEFRAWAMGLGAATVGTLPLLATFLSKPFDPSPYAPVSRLMWNEVFVDCAIPPEFDAPSVQEYVSRTDVKDEIRSLQQVKSVDYAAVYRLKRALLHLMRAALQGFPDRRRAYEDFLSAHPEVVEYARFRAATETKGVWRSWPTPTRIPETDPGLVADFAYAQWLAREQLDAASRNAKRGGLGLYLDFPLGVHSDGFDAWKDQALFVNGLAVGAPADRFFSTGQNWGFAPMNPERLRETRYESYIKAVRHACEASGVLRIDHVMGLHRLFVIPDGMGADAGGYLHYPSHELYAILSIESHRHRTVLVGEDLGAVPPYVRPTLRQRGINRMFILQASIAPEAGKILDEAPEPSLASLNTHDMAPFAAFWDAQDIPMKISLGLLRESDTARVAAAKQRRETVRDAILETLRHEGLLTTKNPALEDVLDACLIRLARSRARLMSVALEDLWLERQPQNIPGTGPTQGNWSRKLPYPMGLLKRQAPVVELLRRVDDARREAGR